MPGDVLMVATECSDKITGKSFTWRWFGVVFEPGTRSTGVLNLTTNKATRIHSYSLMQTSELLEEPDWPDGVRALRLLAILEGRIDLEA